MTPEQAHDTELLRLFLELHRSTESLAWRTDLYLAMAKQIGAPFTRSFKAGKRLFHLADGTPATIADAQPFLAERAISDLPPGSDRVGATDALARIQSQAQAVARLAKVEADIEAHEVGYTGWIRYFLVTSSSGHVHRRTDCSTCFKTTEYAPVPSLSGEPHEDAIEALGEVLCTVCYPSAPVGGKLGKVTASQAMVLLEKGEEAFQEMRAKYLARQARFRKLVEREG